MCKVNFRRLFHIRKKHLKYFLKIKKKKKISLLCFIFLKKFTCAAFATYFMKHDKMIHENLLLHFQ